jgi:hypothetical protein
MISLDTTTSCVHHAPERETRISLLLMSYLQGVWSYTQAPL